MAEEPVGNYFGGSWTKEKIDIFLKYCLAYMNIMKNQKFKLVYFDGFAGSGTIEDVDGNALESVAVQVLSINEPISFNTYYLVELDKTKVASLEKVITNRFPHKVKNTFVVCEDCNVKLVALASYLSKNKKDYSALSFIDPFGMNVDFKSLESFKGIGCDMWILFPSGIGVNRMLKKREETIPPSWYAKLEKVLGMTEEEIKSKVYKPNPQTSLFGERSLKKQDDTIDRIIEMYSERLKGIWKYVSKPHPMKNSTGSIMFHFLLVSQNSTAVKIADDIVKRYNI